MKLVNKIWLMALIAGITITACDKKDNLTVYAEGANSVLSSSAATLTPAPADSNKTVLTLNWSSPKYATDTASYKFLIEMDSTGKNFSKPNSWTVMGKLSTSYIAKELNNLLLARNYAFNQPVDMDVRLTSSYGNNNEKRVSNVIKIRMTP